MSRCKVVRQRGLNSCTSHQETRSVNEYNATWQPGYQYRLVKHNVKIHRRLVALFPAKKGAFDGLATSLASTEPWLDFQSDGSRKQDRTWRQMIQTQGEGLKGKTNLSFWVWNKGLCRMWNVKTVKTGSSMYSLSGTFTKYSGLTVALD